jgi:hypothetical protein
MGEAEFSMYWWDPDGNQHRELSFVTAREAVEKAHSFTTRPAARMGMVKKIMITDGLDFCVFLWEDGKIVHPSEDILAEARSPRSDA